MERFEKYFRFCIVKNMLSKDRIINAKKHEFKGFTTKKSLQFSLCNSVTKKGNFQNLKYFSIIL